MDTVHTTKSSNIVELAGDHAQITKATLTLLVNSNEKYVVRKFLEAIFMMFNQCFRK
jgi:hypothetical protein